MWEGARGVIRDEQACLSLLWRDRQTDGQTKSGCMGRGMEGQKDQVIGR